MSTTEKDLGITEVRGAKANISDLQVYGDGDTFALLCKASSQSQGWMKSTKVCNVEGGCIVQVTTQQKNPDGSYSIAEALTYVPAVQLDKGSEPRKFVSIWANAPALSGRLELPSEEDKQRHRKEQYFYFLLEAQKAGCDFSHLIEEELVNLKP